MQRFRMVAALLAVVAMAVACGGSESASSTSNSNPIKLGVVDTFSGNLAALGTDHLNGAKIAINEVNASGGVLGKKIQLSTQDDQATSRWRFRTSAR